MTISDLDVFFEKNFEPGDVPCRPCRAVPASPVISRNGGGTLKISAAERGARGSIDDFGLRRFFRKNFEPGDFEWPPPDYSDADRGGSRHRSPMSSRS